LSFTIPLHCTTPATTATSPLSLHDALPISDFSTLPRECADREHSREFTVGKFHLTEFSQCRRARPATAAERLLDDGHSEVIDSEDRKSTRLNSSHVSISYAVFCLKKKKYTL